MKNGFTKKEQEKYPELCRLLSGMSEGKKKRKRVMRYLDNMFSDYKNQKYDKSSMTIPTDTLDEMLNDLEQMENELEIRRTYMRYFATLFENGSSLVSPVARQYLTFIRSLPVGAVKVSANEWELPEEKKSNGRTDTAAKATPAKRRPGRPRKTDTKKGV